MEPNNTQEKYSPTGINISERERKIVNSFQKERGLGFSAALRFIINEWAELKPYKPVEAAGENADA